MKKDKFQVIQELLSSHIVTLPEGMKILGLDFVAMKYSIGDSVRVTEMFDENYGTVGTIIRNDKDDDSYLLEFEFDTPFGPTKHTAWYYGTSDFIHSNMTHKPTPVGLSYCAHDWKEDVWFTSKVFKTCKKCGKKFEDK